MSSLELLDTPVSECNYIEVGEHIHVHMESDEFHDDEPGPPKMVDGVMSTRDGKRVPYMVIICLLFSYY